MVNEDRILDNRMLDVTKDVLIFSFYASGMNMIDMARLEDRNMNGKGDDVYQNQDEAAYHS